jgi:hypothetical protein
MAQCAQAIEPYSERPTGNVWPKNANMVFNFGTITADRSFEIRLFFVTSVEEEAVHLAGLFSNLAYRITVTWVQADFHAADTIKDIMAAQLPSIPSAIILDYDSFGQGLWNIFRTLRCTMGERYVEYVIVDLPESETGHFDLQAANVTAIPSVNSATCL